MKHDAEPSAGPSAAVVCPDNRRQFATDAATAFVVLAAMPGRDWSQGPHHQPAAACTARFALRDNHIGPGGTDWPRGVKTTPGKFT